MTDAPDKTAALVRHRAMVDEINAKRAEHPRSFGPLALAQAAGAFAAEATLQIECPWPSGDLAFAWNLGFERSPAPPSTTAGFRPRTGITSAALAVKED